jgi:hypothetical protein
MPCTCTLRETSGTSIGVHTSYGMEKSVKAIIANDENVYKNVNSWTCEEVVKFNSQSIGNSKKI